MKRRTRFRGDLQVDGQILGSDGQPIGGGGSFDPTVPIPELHFAGDPTDDTSGMNIYWDEDWWGLAFSQPPGADDAEIYLWADVEDDPTHAIYMNLCPGGISGRNDSIGGFTLNTRGLVWDINNDSVVKNGPDIGMIYGYGPTGNQWKIDGDYGRFYSILGTYYGEIEHGALYFGRFGDSLDYPRYQVDHDGKTSWGDGTADPDVSLEYGGADIDGIGLKLTGNLYLGLDPEYSTEGIELSPAYGIYGQDDTGNGYSVYGGGIDLSGSAGGSFRVRNAGGGIFNIEIKRTPEASLYPAFASGVQGGSPDIQIMNDGSFAWTAGGLGYQPFDLTIERNSAGFLDVGGSSPSGIIAHSPDGTAYKLTPPNGGGPAEWVAA